MVFVVVALDVSLAAIIGSGIMFGVFVGLILSVVVSVVADRQTEFTLKLVFEPTNAKLYICQNYWTKRGPRENHQ